MHVGKFLKKTLDVQTHIRPCRGDLFFKNNKRAVQIPILMQDGINVQGDFFLKNNKRAEPIKSGTIYVLNKEKWP